MSAGERAIAACAVVVFLFLAGFTVWLFAFGNGGCPKQETPVVTGYTTVVQVGSYGNVQVTQVPDFACEPSRS